MLFSTSPLPHLVFGGISRVLHGAAADDERGVGLTRRQFKWKGRRQLTVNVGLLGDFNRRFYGDNQARILNDAQHPFRQLKIKLAWNEVEHQMFTNMNGLPFVRFDFSD